MVQELQELAERAQARWLVGAGRQAQSVRFLCATSVLSAVHLCSNAVMLLFFHAVLITAAVTAALSHRHVDLHAAPAHSPSTIPSDTP